MLRRQLAAELRRMRERAGRTVAEVAEELGWSESKLSRVETANSGIRNPDLVRLLACYQATDADRARMLALAGQGRQRAWWEAYGNALPSGYETLIAMEADATSIFTYEAQVVPGLLQTVEYASAVIQADGVYDDPEVLNDRIRVRMARQEVLIREPPPDLVAILDEAVLRRPIGGPAVLHRQLLRLLETGDRPTTTIQVLPFSAGAHRALAGSFIVLEFAGGPDHQMVYSEGLTGGVFRNKPEELRSYLMSFEALRHAALGPKDSAEFIGELARGVD
jgi:transcriptional regulator with XRE-family HTH domain